MNNNVAESTIQLLDASELDNVDRVKDLLAQGADLNAQNEAGVTALMVAAGYGGEKVAKHLLSLPTIDTEVREEELGWTALLWAAGQGQLRLVKMLLQHGADPGAVSNLGVTALMLAAANGREDVADYLLCLPTIDTEVRDEEGCTALLWAAGVGQLRLMKMLLQHGADPGAVSNRSVTALMLAAENGREEVADYLLSLPSTDMEAKCEDGATALLWAACRATYVSSSCCCTAAPTLRQWTTRVTMSSPAPPWESGTSWLQRKRSGRLRVSGKSSSTW